MSRTRVHGYFFFSSRRRHTRFDCDWSSDVCSSDLLNVAWLEEPVPADDLDGYAHLRRSVRVPLAAGETEFGLFGFRDLIARGCVDVLQPEVARIGGGPPPPPPWGPAPAPHPPHAPPPGVRRGLAPPASPPPPAAAP